MPTFLDVDGAGFSDALAAVASEMDGTLIGPPGVNQDAIHHQQIHHQPYNVTDINGGLSVEQSVHHPQ